MTSPTWTRRTFLISSAITATTAAVTAHSLDLLPTEPVATDGARAAPLSSSPVTGRPLQALLPRRAKPVPVAIAHGRHYGDLVTRAVRAIGGGQLLDAAGKVVLIKPALAWDRAPGLGVNVHPDVLRAVIELALRGGARQVVVCDRTTCHPDWAYRVSGATRVVHDIGDRRVSLVALSSADFVPLALTPSDLSPSADAATLANCWVCRYVLEADRVINLATMRQHPTRGDVSLAMANLLGLIGGGPADAEWLKHRDDELALLSAAIRPDLTLLDATAVVVRNGPLGRGAQDVAHLHTVVASLDPVAVESVGLHLFAQATQTTQTAPAHLVLAEQLGLGWRVNAPSDRRVARA